MTSKFASRIYITNSKNEARYIELYKNGKIFTGHVGGVALSGNSVYLSNSKKIYEIKLEDILNNEKVEIGDLVLVAASKVPVAHGQFVKITQHCQVSRDVFHFFAFFLNLLVLLYQTQL